MKFKSSIGCLTLVGALLLTGVRFISQRAGKHLLVLPSDALSLVQNGRVDRRLFDVTAMLDFHYDDRRKDLPVIVTHADAAGARSAVAPAGARVSRTLPSVNGQAVRVSRTDAGAFWRDMTAGSQGRALGQGVTTLWLDGLRRPSLDESVPQIGAPAAWQTGYTGAGATGAVLDTGIDTTHPDLAGGVTATRNFSDDPDARDLNGHGTHVASTIAGSGAASAGRYKGVAPGAKLLNGKVCDQFGLCSDSSILAGMEWAAAQPQVKVVNMSLGAPDAPGIDPLEQAVNTLTAQHGTLFVIAAGNDGEFGDSTVGSPGSADAALTVGAVDKSDRLADFSSRGPRVGDAAIKPDITAPGVAITAARAKDAQFGEPGQTYVELDGTSMATPHVAGSATILAQQHPTWTAGQLKSALMGSAKPSAGAGVFAQVAGRVDVARAITQSVTAVPASLSFGNQLWPHGDDAPIAKTVTYHNYGSAALTLNLALKTTGPDGTPTPAGLFTVSSPKISVPASGVAKVTVEANTSVASPDVVFSGTLLATAGGVSVRTPLAVTKEVESYNLHLTHRDRAGHLASEYLTRVLSFTKSIVFEPYEADGTVSLRLPKGRYLLNSVIFSGSAGNLEDSILVQPVVDLSQDRSISVDTRLAKPVSVTVPRRAARPDLMDIGFEAKVGELDYIGELLVFNRSTGIYTGQLGESQLKGLVSRVSTYWADPDANGDSSASRVTYQLFWYERDRMMAGLNRHLVHGQLAKVEAGFAQHHAGVQGTKWSFGHPPGNEARSFAPYATFNLPFRRTDYYNTDGEVEWLSSFEENVDDGSGVPAPISLFEQPRVTYRPGQVVRESWNIAPFVPAAGNVTRSADTILADMWLYGDAAGRPNVFGFGKTTLFRDGKKLAETPTRATASSLCRRRRPRTAWK